MDGWREVYGGLLGEEGEGEGDEEANEGIWRRKR